MRRYLHQACVLGFLLPLVSSAGTRVDTFNAIVRGEARTVHPIYREPPITPPVRVIDNVPAPTARVDSNAAKAMDQAKVSIPPPPPPNLNHSVNVGRGNVTTTAHKIAAARKDLDLAINPNLSTRQRDLLLAARAQNLALIEPQRTLGKRIETLEASKLDPGTRTISTAKIHQSTVPRNKVEQQLWADTLANPRSGNKLGASNKDHRFSPADGWIKLYKRTTAPRGDGRTNLHEIHYQLNDNTGLVADMKIIHTIIDR